MYPRQTKDRNNTIAIGAVVGLVLFIFVGMYVQTAAYRFGTVRYIEIMEPDDPTKSVSLSEKDDPAVFAELRNAARLPDQAGNYFDGCQIKLHYDCNEDGSQCSEYSAAYSAVHNSLHAGREIRLLVVDPHYGLAFRTGPLLRDWVTRTYPRVTLGWERVQEHYAPAGGTVDAPVGSSPAVQ